MPIWSLTYSFGAHTGPAQDLIDVGWTSVWVKVVTQWCVAGLYMWTMVAPSLLTERDF